MERHSVARVAVAALVLLAVGWLAYALVTVPLLALFAAGLLAPALLLFGAIHVGSRLPAWLAARTTRSPDWAPPTGSASSSTERPAD